MKQRGFSLLELMAVLAVLSILCILLVRLSGETQTAVGLNLRRMNADGQAQIVFDRIGTDLSKIMVKQDTPISVNESGGGHLLKFFSSVSSASGAGAAERAASVISYRMASGAQSGSPLPSPEVCFQRAAKNVQWADAIMGRKADDAMITFADVENAHDHLAIVPADYDILGQGVIRAVIGYRSRATGKFRTSPPAGQELQLSDVGGFLVTVIAVDLSSMKLLGTGQWNDVAATFPDPQLDGNGDWLEAPSVEWAGVLRDPGNFSGIPKVPIQSIGVYQRFYPIKSDASMP